MAVVAGAADLGRISVMDYIASSEVPLANNADEQEAALQQFVAGMAQLRAAHWHEAR
jgi:hypothetical protein